MFNKIVGGAEQQVIISGAVIAPATTGVDTGVGAAGWVEGGGGITEETGRGGVESTVLCVVIVLELSWGLRERVIKAETKAAIHLL